MSENNETLGGVPGHWTAPSSAACSLAPAGRLSVSWQPVKPSPHTQYTLLRRRGSFDWKLEARKHVMKERGVGVNCSRLMRKLCKAAEELKSSN